MPVYVLCRIPSCLSHSCILGTIYLSSIEICWHWVYSLLVHVVLVYLYWIPIIEIIFTICCLESIDVPIPKDSVCHHFLCISINRCSFLSSKMARKSCWIWLSRNLLASSILEILILSCELINLNIFLIISLIGSFKLLS